MAARNESWYKVVSNSSVLRRHLNDVGGRMSLSKMLNVITIIVSKMTTRLLFVQCLHMTSHCVGTAQTNEEPESRWDRKVRRDVI